MRGINSSTAVVMEDVKIIIKSQKETFDVVESNGRKIERLDMRSGGTDRNGLEYFEKYVVDEIKSVKSKTRHILEDTQLIVDIGKHNRRQLDRLDDLINSKDLGRREEKKNPTVQLLDQMKQEYNDREDIRRQLNIPQSRKSSTALNEEDQTRKIKAEVIKEQCPYSRPIQQEMDNREVIEIVEEDEAYEEEVGRKVKFIDTSSSCKRPAENVWDTGEDPPLLAPTIPAPPGSPAEERPRKKPSLEERLKAGSFLSQLTAREGAGLDRLHQVEEQVLHENKPAALAAGAVTFSLVRANNPL